MLLNQMVFIFISLFIMGLGFFVLVRDSTNIINKRFCVFTQIVSVWIFFIFLTVSTTNPISAAYRLRLVYSAAIFIPASFFFFTSIFPDRVERTIDRYLSISFFIISSLFACFSLHIVDTVTFEKQAPHARYGSLFPLFWVYFIPCMVYSLYNLYRKSLCYQGIKKLQVQYLFFGVSIFVFIGVITNFILPTMGIWQAEMFAPFVSIPIPVTVAYAIVKYHLMDISVVIKRSTVYFILSIIISAIYFIVGLILGNVLPVSEYKDTVTAWVSITVVVLVFVSARESIQHIIEKVLFHTKYSHPKILSDSTAIFSTIHDLDGLFRYAIQYLYDSVGIGKVCILTKDTGTNRYMPKAAINFLPENNFPLLSQDAVVQWFNKNRTVLSRDQLNRFAYNLQDSLLENILISLDADSCIPVFQGNELFGLILLGRKINKKIFTQEDIQMFLAFSGQLAMAAHNARLYSGLKEAKTYRDNILQSLTTGVIVVDNNSEVTLMNNEAKRILGLKVVDATEKIFDDLGKDVCQMFAHTLRRGTEYHNVEAFIKRGSKKIPCGVTITRLKTEDGERLGALMILTDLTEIKLLQAEKQNADRMAQFGTLAANIAHEIKNPLVAINTYFQLLPHKKDDGEFMTSFQQIALKETDRINRIIEDLLNLAKPSKSYLQQIDPHSAIMDTISLLKGVAVEKNIEIKTFLEGTRCKIVADEDKVKQMLINILQNGLDASPRNGGITISTTLMDNLSLFRKKAEVYPNNVFYTFSLPFAGPSHADGRYFVVKISDNGTGISDEKISHIFEPFFTSKEKGTGLGLAMVYRIIKDHGGGIFVESREGFGTDFYVSLPVSRINI